MNKRYFFLALATLLIGLLTGTVASGSAQTPMTETYTWQPHGLALHYPADWTVVQKNGVISLRPANRDVTDGRGPELILFNVPGGRADNLDAMLTEVSSSTGANVASVQPDQIDGYDTVTGVLLWRDPDATGMMTLIALNDQTVIGVAYVVRTSDESEYMPTLKAIRKSLSLDRAATVASVESSASVASVQLPQRYVWQATGLVLYLPENWNVDLQTDADSATLFATPDPATARGDDLYHLLQGVVLDSAANMDLQTVAAVASNEYSSVSDFAETTIAGQPGITYDAVDTASDLPLHLRPVFVSLADGRVAMLTFSTRDTGWDHFRPAVSAIISSIEPAAPSDTSATITPRALISRRADAPDQGTAPEPFVWEDYGISFTLPEGWIVSTGDGQNYDLALVSPEAIQNSGVGAFITLLGFPGLATGGNTFEAALQPIADQLETSIETQTINGLDVFVIRHIDEEQGADRRFILVPYGTRGDAIYIQSTTPTGGGEVQGLLGPISGDDAVQTILDSMIVNVVTPDYAAVDAAWQTSLAETGRLIVGDADAPIKLREYLSFTCSHCVHYSRSMERLIALDVETGRVQYEFAPLGGDAFARNAALATFCAAEQGKGYSASELLFQGDMEQGAEVAYTPDGVREILSTLDLDMDALDTCLEDQRYLDNITAIGVEFNDQGLTGTPTITIGVGDDPIEPMTFSDGQIFSGAIPLHFLRDLFTSVIDNGMTVQEYLQQ